MREVQLEQVPRKPSINQNLQPPIIAEAVKIRAPIDK